jgi:membrane protein DedA with SNARE-associated domain
VQHLVDLIAWIEPHAILLAILLPPLIRVVGHWIPEELFMVTIGVLAARSPTASTAATILGAVLLSHFVTDQIVYLGGRWLRPRLGRFPRVEARLASVTERLADSPGALLGLVPARVLPLGRGAWLAASGVVRVPWARFASIDLAALIVHTGVWSGLGWWFAGDLGGLAASADTGRVAGLWLAAALITAFTALILWRSREAWQPRTIRTVRRAGRSFKRFGRDADSSSTR